MHQIVEGWWRSSDLPHFDDVLGAQAKSMGGQPILKIRLLLERAMISGGDSMLTGARHWMAGLVFSLAAGTLALSGCAGGSSPLGGALSNPFAQGTSDFDITFLSASSTWDMNKDGVVTCDEWKQYSGELLRESDTDGDLALTTQEWANLIGKDKLFVTANHEYYDVNNDGKVALVELTERPNHAFKLLDKDKDCQLGHAEKANVYSVAKEKTKAVDPSQVPGGPGGR